MRVSDGSGKGNHAKVGTDLRLHVESRSRPSVEVAAQDGQSFIFHAECHLAAATSGGLMYFKNTSNTHDVIIERLFFDAHTLTPTDLILVQVKNPATVTSGTDISDSTAFGKVQKNYGSGGAIVGTLVVSDGSLDITYTGGQQYHAFPIKAMSSVPRDMRGTNVITPNTTILWGWKSAAGATNAEIISLSVNVFTRLRDVT